MVSLFAFIGLVLLVLALIGTVLLWVNWISQTSIIGYLLLGGLWFDLITLIGHGIVACFKAMTE